MPSTQVAFEPFASHGVVNGEMRHASGNDMFNIVGISYPIMAKSVAQELKTNVFSVEIKAMGLPRGVDITLANDLPVVETLVSKINAAISETFIAWTSAGNKVPVFISTSQGYAWYNPTAADVVIDFKHRNMQILMLGIELPTLTITPNETSRAFRPDPRLGAVTQNLVLHPSGIEFALPLSGERRDSLYVSYINHVVRASSSSITGSVTVEFPSIATTVVMANNIRSVFNIYTSHLNIKSL